MSVLWHYHMCKYLIAWKWMKKFISCYNIEKKRCGGYNISKSLGRLKSPCSFGHCMLLWIQFMQKCSMHHDVPLHALCVMAVLYRDRSISFILSSLSAQCTEHLLLSLFCPIWGRIVLSPWGACPFLPLAPPVGLPLEPAGHCGLLPSGVYLQSSSSTRPSRQLLEMEELDVSEDALDEIYLTPSIEYDLCDCHQAYSK